MTDCTAIRQNDEMHCATCHLRWDVTDPEPPLCGRECPSIVPGDAPVTVATRSASEFVSALAPDIFRRRL
jgi:hypothetical protein